LRREGRRKRKAGAKNEKANLIITLPLYRGQEKIPQISKENKFFYKKTPFFRIEKREKAASLCKNNHKDTTASIRLHRPTAHYPSYVRP